MTLIVNMFTIVVLSHQMYTVGRLLTAGPMGFEIGKSLYLNSDITTLRHLAVIAFFRSIPLFLFSVAVMVYQMVNPLGDYFFRILGGCVAALFVVAGIFITSVFLQQRAVFKEKTLIGAKYEAPMHVHMNNLPGPLSPRALAFD